MRTKEELVKALSERFFLQWCRRNHKDPIKSYPQSLWEGMREDATIALEFCQGLGDED